MDALAYTQGSEIHVGPGQEKHLAHEAWHVVQQKEGRVEPTLQAKGVAINDDVGLEREADVMGERAVRSLSSAGVSGAMAMTALPGTMQLQRKKPPQQRTNDVDTLYEDASLAFEDLKRFTIQFAEETGGIPVIPAELKLRQKTIDKANRDYKGDTSRVLDIARTTIKYDTMKQIDQMRTQIESRLPEILPGAHIARVKDSFAKPTQTGYRDLKYNIQASNGHITELQVHLTAIEEAKPKQRPYYDEIFRIGQLAEREGRDLTPQETNRVRYLNRQSRKIFKEALESSMGDDDNNPS